jgi:hypothetical protein
MSEAGACSFSDRFFGPRPREVETGVPSARRFCVHWGGEESLLAFFRLTNSPPEESAFRFAGAPPFVCKGGFMPQAVASSRESRLRSPRTSLARKSSPPRTSWASGASRRQQSRPRDLLFALSSGVPSGTKQPSPPRNLFFLSGGRRETTTRSPAPCCRRPSRRRVGCAAPQRHCHCLC